MKNIFLMFVFSALLTGYAFGQTHQNVYVDDGNTTLFMQTGTDWGTTKFDAKYLKADWEMGNLQTTDQKIITDVAFMYNVTFDKFEIRADVNPSVVKRINFGGKVFIYSDFIQDDLTRSGYFELLSEGRTVLLKRYSVQTTAAKGGALVGHDAYQNINQDLYVKKENEPAVLIKRKKTDIIDALADHKTELEKYTAENHLKMINTKDIIQLLNYYSTLEEKD